MASNGGASRQHYTADYIPEMSQSCNRVDDGRESLRHQLNVSTETKAVKTILRFTRGEESSFRKNNNFFMKTKIYMYVIVYADGLTLIGKKEEELQKGL